ncbi:MAG: alpha/beta hydrolase [bacterium]
MHRDFPELAHTWVPGQEPLFLFLHGLGADGRCFRDALDAPGLRGRALLIPDLGGFGKSPHQEDFSYTMEAQAELVRNLCCRLGAKDLSIIGHSMGGAIGICLAEMWPGLVTHFANAAGNLVPEDCFFSRALCDMDWDTFEKRGFEEFKAKIEVESVHSRKSLASYLSTLKRTTADAMYRSSRDLVRLCDEGKLLSRFLSLSCRKLYLHDVESEPPPHFMEALRRGGVPILRIPESGHSLMEDNPSVFYAALADFLAVK